MTDHEGWQWDADGLQQTLEALGYDVMTRDARRGTGGGSLRARREQASRTHLLAIDAAGRYRASVSRIREERGWSGEVAGAPVRVLREVKGTTTVSGQVESASQIDALLTYLDTLDAGPRDERTDQGQSK